MAALCSSGQRALADITISEISSQRDCGTFLTIKTSPGHDGLVELSVRVQAEVAANAGDLYRGRVSTTGGLKIATSDAKLATMEVQPSSEKNAAVIEFQFQLAPKLAQDSVFTLRTSLFEKDGTPTIGGGQIFNIRLKGFVPADQGR